MPMENAYAAVYVAALIVLGCGICCSLIRAIIGKRIADRLVAINMIGTMVIAAIAILAVWLKQSYLIDVCMIYAMLSFLAVVVLSKVYMGIHEQKKREKERDGEQ